MSTLLGYNKCALEDGKYVVVGRFAVSILVDTLLEIAYRIWFPVLRVGGKYSALGIY